MKIHLNINHKDVHFAGLVLCVLGLLFSKPILSSAEIIIAINWLTWGNLRNKFCDFLKNKAAIVCSTVYLIHLVGLLYTKDWQFASNDLRIKLPILFFPVFLSTSPALSKKEFNTLLYFFISSVFVSSLVSLYIYLGFSKKLIVDFRQISVFISHIIFSLLVCLTIFILLWLIFNECKNNIILKMLFAGLIIWFIVFIFILQSFTGIVILIVMSFVMLFYELIKMKSYKLKIGILMSVITLLISIIWLIHTQYKEIYKVNKIDLTKLESRTKEGNYYNNDTISKETENGNLIWIYVCDKEMREEWNKRSLLNYDGKDLKNQVLKLTIIRYLTSKGLKKDGEGIKKLKNEEIQYIEKGIANIKYSRKFSFTNRLSQIIWEFKQSNARNYKSVYSVAQRIEFWKTGMMIIKDNYLIGVGTGDLKIAFDEQYKKENSSLDESHRLRAHNQFITIFIAFGIIGLAIFLICIFYPATKLKMWNNYFYVIFFIIFFLSLINEDTLETQAGATFFAFFNSLFLFRKKND
ncbi:MAG: O-antigen ligase family protein [Bacteroidota bacterium]|nr:O-antigen ligase family protein [Bacteroidota bacterium]